ncbi:glycosyltransferase [Pseudophaeobacter leonis]|uniref:glycosyltransferase n=1 Tax=Pseudophaeobacter leonis TaxID=1144477 RepID=UPI0009F17BF0|nr:glycosyltransferase [Pseudophaeobacter leonis]
MPDTPRLPSLLIYAPVPLHLYQGRFYIECQAVNGLRLWAQHFHPVTVMMPVSAEAPPQGWEPLGGHLKDLAEVNIEPLPMAYRPDQFARALPRSLRRIRDLIAQADYLSFAIGGLFGDWGAVSCLAAHQMRRPFAVWTDRVESDVMRQAQERAYDKALDQTTRRSRLRARLYHRPMAWLERAVISRADLGLFHGAETYQAFQQFCRNPQLVHDIHIAESDHIGLEELTQKMARVRTGPLRLVYAGRADAMKGPIDWTTVLERLKVMGVEFEATWLGDGEALPQMRARIARAGLAEQVHFAGFVADRAAVLSALRRADLFMFCHKTAESPRCLIEALTCGTPILGYGGAYAEDLISGHAGGVLVPRGDTEALADEVARLDADRPRLAQMIANARSDGMPFSDTQVFAHRAAILKAHLPTDQSDAGGRAKPDPLCAWGQAARR